MVKQQRTKPNPKYYIHHIYLSNHVHSARALLLASAQFCLCIHHGISFAFVNVLANDVSLGRDWSALNICRIFGEVLETIYLEEAPYDLCKLAVLYKVTVELISSYYNKLSGCRNFFLGESSDPVSVGTTRATVSTCVGMETASAGLKTAF